MPEKVKILISILSLVLLITIGVFEPDQINFTTCEFRELTGYSCPTCGITRSFHASVHLNFTDALKYNPFGILIVTALIAFLLNTVLEFVNGGKYSIKLKSSFYKYALLLLFICWVVFWIARIISESL